MHTAALVLLALLSLEPPAPAGDPVTLEAGPEPAASPSVEAAPEGPSTASVLLRARQAALILVVGTVHVAAVGALWGAAAGLLATLMGRTYFTAPRSAPARLAIADALPYVALASLGVPPLLVASGVPVVPLAVALGSLVVEGRWSLRQVVAATGAYVVAASLVFVAASAQCLAVGGLAAAGSLYLLLRYFAEPPGTPAAEQHNRWLLACIGMAGLALAGALLAWLPAMAAGYAATAAASGWSIPASEAG